MAGGWRASLKTKLIFLSVTSVTTVLLALGLYQNLERRAQLRAEMDASLEASAARLSTNLEGPVWNMSREQASDVLRTELSLPDALAVVVRGEDGEIFAALVKSGGQPMALEPGAEVPEGERKKAFELRRDGKAFATGEVRWTEEALRARLREQLRGTLVQIVLVDVVLVAMLLFVLSALVLRPLNVLAAEATWLRDAVAQGRLDVRGDASKVAVEFRPVLDGMNATMDAYAEPIALAAETVTRIAGGDLPPAIPKRFAGDFDRIIASLNALIDTATRRGRDMDALIAATVDGRLDVRADPAAYRGWDARVIDGMNRMLDALVTPLRLAGSALERIARGDIPATITATYRGDYDRLKENINTCIGAVNALIEDADGLAAAAVRGNLGIRADASRHLGDFRRIVEGVNATLDAVMGPLDAAARCVEAISCGEIPERITAAWAGDFARLRDNLNTCIDAVNALVHDSNALAEAAIEGRLDTRADSTRHRADFRKIIDGANRTVDALLAPVREATVVLEALAARDLRARVEGQFRGDHAKLNDAVNTTASALHEAVVQVAGAVEQVSGAASQIASSAQAVATGAAAQATTLDETTASVGAVEQMATTSAEHADHASALALSARVAAGRGDGAVGQLQGAMGKIKEAAERTGQIIKDVSEIAFQTNLLALNAAVEAARAGEAGRGFAVVAEEVRSLALRAKEAAAKTEDLIRQSVKQAGEGDIAAGRVSGALQDITAGVTKVTDIVAEIAAAAKEQAAAVRQVTRSISEMQKVVQQNAASAEQSSAAANELSGQADDLASMVASFRLELQQPPRGPHVRRDLRSGPQPEALDA